MSEEKEKSVEETNAEELNTRVNSFLEEYRDLVTKQGIDFASYPMFVPDGKGGFQVVVKNTPVDIRNQPQQSPFVGK